MTDCQNRFEDLDLDASDPALGRIARVLRSSPEIPDEDIRKSRIAAALAAASALNQNTSMKLPFLKYVFTAGGVAVVILAIIVSSRTPGAPILGTGSPTAATQLGFGKLPGLSAAEVAPEAAALGGTLSKSLAAGDAAVSAPGSAGSGVASMIAPSLPSPESPVPSPDEMRCLLPEGCPEKPIPPEYLPPRVIYEWKGSSLPEIPAELAVFRALPFAFASEISRTVLDRISGGNLFQGDLSILNFTLRDAEYTWSFDAGSGSVSFWPNDSGPVYALKGQTEPAAGVETTSVAPDRAMIFPPPSPSPSAPSIPDDEAIRIANDFLSSRGIDLGKYGAPQVQKYPYWDCRSGPCPLAAEIGGVTADESAYPIWYQPETTVWYPGKIDGWELADWQGQPQQATTIAIDGATKKVRNGSILILPAFESSLYSTISAQDALERALRGGLNAYGETPDIYPPEVETKRPVVRITLTEAKLAYFQKISYDAGGSATFYLPVVAFTGTITDQYGNASPWGTLVPALASDSFRE